MLRQLEAPDLGCTPEPLGHIADHAVAVACGLSLGGDRAEDHVQVNAHRLGGAILERVDDSRDPIHHVAVGLCALDFFCREF